MGENSSDFRAALVDLVDGDRPRPDPHPSPEQWIAYQRGELAEADEARLAEHLVRCRDCCDLAQAAAAFAAPEEEPGPDGELAAAALWRDLRPRLQGAEGAGPAARAQTGGRGATGPVPLLPFRRFSWPAALAASLALACLGLTAWNLRLRSDLAELRAPRPGAPVFYLAAGERLSGGETTVPAGPGPWILVLQPGEELPLYDLVVRDAATGRELHAHRLRPDADLALTLGLPAGLPPGRYLLELRDGAGGRVVEEHRLRVVEGGAG